MDTFNEIRQFINERFKLNSELFGEEDDIFDVLQVDSLQVLELLTELENHYHIEIPDYEFQSIKTFGELTKLIQRRL